MKYFNTILIVITTILFLAAGIFGLSISFNIEGNQMALKVFQNMINYMMSGETAKVLAIRITVFSFSLLLVLIGIFTIWGNMQKRLSERTVILQSPMGEILVSLNAIEDFSRVVRNQVDGVKDIKGRVISTRKGMKVSAYVTLYSDHSVADVTQEIQKAIIQYIQFTLGISTEIKPNIIVNKIAYRPKEEKK
ncbi:MAG: alkaline shock response membrane anchor protein AmaP [Spirochaetia bacterium]|nr:alkaline shock response membrane anchor protein AmaP [Spirochaetia bacterium]